MVITLALGPELVASYPTIRVMPMLAPVYDVTNDYPGFTA